MIAEFFAWAWVRFRPREGWLTLALVLALLACLVGAVLEVGWTPEAGVVGVTAVSGFCLALLLAKRPLNPRSAWLLLSAYGLLISLVFLANLRPPWAVWRSGWGATADYWRQNGALFLDRAASWFIAVFQGSQSRETIVFSWGLALGGWFLAAYAAWAVFRRRQPLTAIVFIGLALALNNYFGLAELWWLAVFVGLATMTVALAHFTNLEESWRQTGVDYSSEIRLELTLLAAVVAVSLLMTAMVVPSLSLRRVAAAWQSLPLVAQLEDGLERVFAGVAQPRQAPRSPGGPGGSGVLPRTYLLGNPPELAAQIVMTATVELAGPDDQWTPATGDLLAGFRWRALSYNVYTGRGWALSEEREEPLAAGQSIPLPPASGQTTLRQTVTWLQDARRIRYTIGLPLRFDHDVVALWRGREDLSRVLGETVRYQAISQVTTARAAALRATAVADVPVTILARYTQLPDELPARVPALAQEIAGDLDNPFDQARALEQFLRQYPYSLDVALPPPDQDPVDFFLFDLQTGYCDYFASAMVVLARSLGLPARTAVGYLAQPPDAAGVQQVRQLDGHSWPELYFAGYGWVAFEPTPAFSSPQAGPRPLADSPDAPTEEPALPQTAVPPRQPAPRPIPRTAVASGLGTLAALAGLGAWWWRRRRRNQPTGDQVVWVYGRLQQQTARLGQAASSSQTPAEFSAAFQRRLDELQQHKRLTAVADRLKPGMIRLTELYNARRYAPPTDAKKQEDETALRTWQGMKRPLLLLWLAKRIMK